MPKFAGHLAVALKSARSRSGITQLALAKHLGVQDPYISDVEAGARMLSRERTIEAAAFLRVPPLELILARGRALQGYTLDAQNTEVDVIAASLSLAWPIEPDALKYLQRALARRPA